MDSYLEFQYVGCELKTLQHAVNWKTYWRSKIAPYMGQRVLEVGAGIGGTTRVFADYQCDQWVALEPDGRMVQSLQEQQQAGDLPSFVDIQLGTVQELSQDLLFDTILYIDVLEHIEAHAAELDAARQHVAVGGYIVVLSPAFQFLYTPFDEAIGHYRRYRRQDLKALTPKNCRVANAFYLDAVGMLASVANLLILRASEPKLSQIKFWDGTIIPISRLFDPLVNFSLGRSVICIYERVE